MLIGQDANLAQVRAGLGWHYKYYQSDQSPADREAYSAAKTSAKLAKAGLWADAHPIPPWDWRRGERSITANTSNNATALRCDLIPTCGELATCDAVVRYVRLCGSSGVDGDGDGVSCESLCR